MGNWLHLLGKKRENRGDAEMMQAIARGSEAAFLELTGRYQQRVLNFAFRFLGSREEAEDVVQETFLRLFKGAGRYDARGVLTAFVFRIVRNLCIDRLRKKRPELPDRLPDPPDRQTPHDHLDRKQAMASLSRAVRGLPENQRTAVILRHTEELSYREIADVMGVTTPAVESLLVRGRRTLRNQLGNCLGCWVNRTVTVERVFK
ncbi:MAG: sigma-70 family RNA polymerase sigma factor [Desulfobacteraceae bacterium]|nr:sigma-70 family RNA polymerase sigma factor [Desulfobacteraceae bacterium]